MVSIPNSALAERLLSQHILISESTLIHAKRFYGEIEFVVWIRNHAVVYRVSNRDFTTSRANGMTYQV